MTDLARLIEKLEAASEGSRELDRAIKDDWIGFDPDNDLPRAVPDVGRIPAPPLPYYTTSIDAAMILLPPGHYWHLDVWPSRECAAQIGLDKRVFRKPDQLALALCIVALKARAAMADK